MKFAVNLAPGTADSDGTCSAAAEAPAAEGVRFRTDRDKRLAPEAAGVPIVPCPCCGRALDTMLTVEEQIVAAALNGRQTDMIRLLAKARGQFVPLERIIDRLYGDDPDGGPLWAGGSVRVLMHSLRARLLSTEARLAAQSRSGRAGGGWRLVSVPVGNPDRKNGGGFRLDGAAR